jgi:hypothetical protein
MTPMSSSARRKAGSGAGVVVLGAWRGGRFFYIALRHGKVEATHRGRYSRGS